MLSRSDLHAYQRRAVDWIKDKHRCGLFVGMGLGKTVSTLTAISDLQDGCMTRRVLIVAPLRVANSVWPAEPLRWQHLKHLRVVTATGSERERLAALQSSADVYVINRENVTWLVKHYGKKWPFDCVVIDESSSFKSPTAKRWRAIKRILPYTEYMILLTGTPSPNGLLDLWAQQYLIDYGQALGRTYTGYKQRFFEADYMGYNWTPRRGSSDKIHALMSERCISMASEDYLDLPERIDLVERIDLAPAVLEQYRQFERDLLTELDDGQELEAVSAAALANKLLQWCNGAAYVDEHGNWSEIHRAKLDALEEIRAASAGENMLVAYNYKSDLARLQKRFPGAVLLDKDPATIDRWNRGDISMLLAHPASAGHGLNLQDGGALCVWFGLNWSLELYQQFNARLHRQGQRLPVRIIHIIATGCLDERVMQVLDGKDKSQKALLSALKQSGMKKPLSGLLRPSRALQLNQRHAKGQR